VKKAYQNSIYHIHRNRVDNFSKAPLANDYKKINYQGFEDIFFEIWNEKYI